MTPRVKSLLLLLATLLIGIVLGGIINARMAEERMERIASMRSSRGLLRYMERMIEPQDAQQRAAVRAILEHAAERMTDVSEQRRREIQAIVDSARAELEQVLTAEQMRQFEERIERMEQRRQEFRQRRERRGPPPGRGPGPPSD